MSVCVSVNPTCCVCISSPSFCSFFYLSVFLSNCVCLCFCPSKLLCLDLYSLFLSLSLSVSVCDSVDPTCCVCISSPSFCSFFPPNMSFFIFLNRSNPVFRDLFGGSDRFSMGRYFRLRSMVRPIVGSFLTGSFSSSKPFPSCVSLFDKNTILKIRREKREIDWHVERLKKERKTERQTYRLVRPSLFHRECPYAIIFKERLKERFKD